MSSYEVAPRSPQAGASPFLIACFHGFYGGAWLVIRKSDLRVITSGHSPFELARARRNFQNDDYWLKRSGSPLSSRVVEIITNSSLFAGEIPC
jgi:hypothetical protein